ncbi:MerR family transcriptional regulator, partial [Enterococcus sp. S165_ASV_20]|nr:MerR family transcriptional regulator [Enterococcus sp. S165_ASV_20]
MYIIHDNETDELTYKLLPVDEKADYEQLLKEL